MIKEVLTDTEDRMKKTVEVFRREMASLKAGRATPALLDKITVDYYGTPTPISQLANINVPEPRLLEIKPWDKSAIKGIEKAILQSDLGINPSNDGAVIRLVIPQLTTERRQDLVKTCHKRAEADRVAIRNERRDANELIKELEKEKTISEDESKRGSEQIQKLTDQYIREIDHILQVKEKEIMEV